MEERGLRLGDILGILRRRGRVLALVAGATTLAGIFVAAILPDRYVAYTTMLIEPQSISKRLVEAGVEGSDMTNRLHLMTMQILSRQRLSRVIEELKLYPELSQEMTREQIIEYMRSQIWVAPVLPQLATDRARRTQQQEINTFQLFFRHENPRVAAAVANRLSQDFIDEHIRDRVQVSGDTAEFIESELERITQRLRVIEAETARIKAENAGSLPEERTASEYRVTRFLDQLRDAQRRMAESQSDADFYSQQAAVLLSNERRRGDVVGRAVSPTLRLQELEISLGEMRARGLTDRHPDVVRTLAEIGDLKARLASEGGGDGALSLEEQEARALAQRARLRAEAEAREIERVQGEIDKILEQLARTPRVAEQLDSLSREYSTLSASFSDYSNKRIEASVAANMERRQKGEQFRVLEQAVAPPEPESPNRPLILGLFLMLGLAVGAAAAILLEASDASYHDARTLQERLRIPVLASVPAIVLDSDRWAERRRRRREIVMAGAVTAAVLVASLGGYLYVNRAGLFDSGAPGSPAASPPPAPAATAPAPLSLLPGAAAARATG
jgi:polysaccharide chain length determinant protein (PEP-CTERM system associated)